MERAVSLNAQMDSMRTSKPVPAHHVRFHAELALTPLNVTPANLLSSRDSLIANATLHAHQEPTPAATTKAAEPVPVDVPHAKTPRTVLHAQWGYSSTESNVETLVPPDTMEMPPTTSADNVTLHVLFAQDPHQVSVHNVLLPTSSPEHHANQDALTESTSLTTPAMLAQSDALFVTTRTLVQAARLATS